MISQPHPCHHLFTPPLPWPAWWLAWALTSISYGKKSCRSILPWAIVNLTRCCKASPCLLLGTDKMLFLFWKVFMLPLLSYRPMGEWCRGRTRGWSHILLDLSSSLRASHILCSLGLFSETGFHSVVWADMELLAIILPLPSECWDYRHEPLTMPGFTSGPLSSLIRFLRTLQSSVPPSPRPLFDVVLITPTTIPREAYLKRRIPHT